MRHHAGATDWRRERHAAVVAQGRRGVGKADDRVAQKFVSTSSGSHSTSAGTLFSVPAQSSGGHAETRVGPGQRELYAGRERLLDLVDVAYLNEVELHGTPRGPDDGGVAVRA